MLCFLSYFKPDFTFFTLGGDGGITPGIAAEEAEASYSVILGGGEADSVCL